MKIEIIVAQWRMADGVIFICAALKFPCKMAAANGIEYYQYFTIIYNNIS
jgi:hypothetical protein